MSSTSPASSAPSSEDAGTHDPTRLVDETEALVERWLTMARSAETKAERRTADRLNGVIVDPLGVAFAMRFVDRVMRPENPAVAAHQLASLVGQEALPGFLSPTDKMLLRAGARLAPLIPRIVMPLAARRMRQLVGHLVVDADETALAKHLSTRSAEHFRLNVNLLGEAVLGHEEADRRFVEAMTLLDQPNVNYVSVKISAVVSQLNYWAFDDCVERVVNRLRPLFRKASTISPPTFINLDMEEYHDLELTTAVFMRLLDEPELRTTQAGIVLQAYLPDSFAVLQSLVDWAAERRATSVDGVAGGEIKIRLVKGANLAMERVDAAIHGWAQAPYQTKAETDANYKRCLDWLLTPERTAAVRLGLASHNLFDVAWCHLLSQSRGVSDRVEFEMLEGMAPALARVTRDAGDGLLLYTPVVSPEHFDVAISYLFRRLEENASDENFIRHLFTLEPGGTAFASEAAKFRSAVAQRWAVGDAPQRKQDRRVSPSPGAVVGPFRNEPDTDPALPGNRLWATTVMARKPLDAQSGMITDLTAVDRAVAVAKDAQPRWAAMPPRERRQVLHAVADELSRRRGDLIAAMVHEGRKTFAQADPEVSEAIDFARFYADRCLELASSNVADFEPLGVIAVIPPWNFPVAIPAGGVLGALAAGNAVVFKPAPETPRCAEIVAECCWEAGLPEGVLNFVRTGDDECGRRLITHDDVAAIILTGGYETAQLFRSWKPDLRIFAETSGKNALIITPNADIDLAVDDLVESAFGHSGQKCSAASLAICVGDVYESPRFRRQLIDAVRSLEVGPQTDLTTTMGPTIAEPEGKLLRGLTELDPGESWLIEPARVGTSTWTPGVRLGVASGSWFHQTECFGPVLGLIAAPDLDIAIKIQNANPYGLTGGIHSLDADEIEQWLETVQIGNAYVNRQITGAIVQRQPFGGWKRSSIGPGAKAGGPNYVAQLGVWRSSEPAARQAEEDPEQWLRNAAASDAAWWDSLFSVEHDPTQLFCEANIFRYRPLDRVAVRMVLTTDHDSAEGRGAGSGASLRGRLGRELARVRSAAERCGVALLASSSDDESAADFAGRLANSGIERVRVLGSIETELRNHANAFGIHLADGPVTADGRIELLHYLREQAISRTLHRYGNLV